MKQNKKRWAIYVALSQAAIGLSFSQPALAGSATLEEVVVEAQKKVETVTETPIAIQALTGDQFQKYASFNLQDVARTTPGLSFDTGVTPDIHLRGVSTVTLAAVSLRTNIYVDGALVEQPRAIFDSQYDIERFEVLKGPQGTLYGKSSPTGTINIRTKNPNLSAVDGYVAGSFGERNLYNTQFGISLPIIENELAVRLAAVYDENQSSGVKNILTDHDAQSRGSGARATILWEPTDKLTGRLSYQYREKKDNSFYVINGDGYRYYDDKLHANVDDYNKYRDQLGILEVSYALTDHYSLVSVTGYEDQDFENLQDTDGLGYSQLAGTGVGQSDLGAVQFVHIPVRPQFQEDLRLASEDNAFWDWQVGFYYQRSSTKTVADVLVYNGSLHSYVHVTTPFIANGEVYALYTHNTFKITDDFNVIFGLRYQAVRSQASQDANFGLSNSTGTPSKLVGIPADQQRKTFYPVSGTLKAQYFFNPDLMTYVTFDRAVRTGATNLNIGLNLPADFASFPDEIANSVEGGLKGNFGDQRGRFALAVFDQIYKDFQQDFQSIVVGAGNSNLSGMVQAAKEAETRGVELNIDWLLQDNWTVSINASFTDSKFIDFKDAITNLGSSCATSTKTSGGVTYSTCDYSGDRLPLSSRWTGNMASNYSLPAFDGGNWYLNALVNVQSDQIDKVTRSTLGGYSTVDLFTGLRSAKDNTWDVNVWLKNVFDRRVITRVYHSDVPSTFDSNGNPVSGGPTFDMVTTNMPRQVGVTGTYRF